MTAQDIMSAPVHAVKPDMSVRELANFFMKKKISGAPVVDETGSFLGIVTEEDLIYQDKQVHLPTFFVIMASVIPLGMDQMEGEIKKIAGTSVRDIMQKKPQTITPATTVEEIATLMSDRKLFFLPVMQDKEVRGVVTKRDIIRAVAAGAIW